MPPSPDPAATPVASGNGLRRLQSRSSQPETDDEPGRDERFTVFTKVSLSSGARVSVDPAASAAERRYQSNENNPERWITRLADR